MERLQSFAPLLRWAAVKSCELCFTLAACFLFVFAGVWAREIAAMVGQHIPLVPMKHAYVVTEEVPGGVRNMPNVRDHDSSVYFRVQGDALCVGGYEPNPIILDNVKEINYQFSNLELLK